MRDGGVENARRSDRDYTKRISHRKPFQNEFCKGSELGKNPSAMQTMCGVVPTHHCNANPLPSLYIKETRDDDKLTGAVT